MSFFGNLFGGGTRDHTTSGTTGYGEEWKGIEDAMRGGFQTGASPFFSNPGYTPAGFNDDQYRAWDGVRGLAMHNQGVNYADQMAGMMGAGQDAVNSAGNAALTSHGDIMALANPMRGEMTDVIIGDINENFDRSQAQNAAQAARRSAFGGSGEAIARAQMHKDQADQVEDASTKIGYDSYNMASGVAQGNTAAKNAAIARQTQAMLQSAGLDMQALNAANSMYGDYQTRNLATLGMLGGIGDQQQQQQQQVNDAPYTGFSRVASMFPGYSQYSTQTQPVNNTGGMGSMMQLAGLFL